MITRPLGAQVGPSSRKDAVSSRSSLAVGAHHADMKPALVLLGEGDQSPRGAPDRGAIAPVAVRDALRLRRHPRSSHKAAGCPTGRFQTRSGCRRANSWARFRSRAHWSTAAPARSDIDTVDIGIAATLQRKHHRAPSGRKARRKGHGAGLIIQGPGGKAGHVHHINLGKAAAVRGEQNPIARGRKARRQHD